MGASFHYHFIRTDDALPHHSHCKEQSNTVNRGGKTWWTLLCAQLSISTSIFISRNKRCQKGQIWAITAYRLHGASRNDSKVLKELLVPFNIGNLECVHLVLFEKRVNSSCTHKLTGAAETQRQRANPALVLWCPSSPSAVAQALPAPSLPCFLNPTQSTSDISLARADCQHAHQSSHWTLQIHVNMDFRVTVVFPSL